MDYKNIVDLFEIKKGDNIWISSELIQFASRFKKMGKKFDGSVLIDEFQRAIGPDGTMMFPTFSFEFSNNHFYDYNLTRGVTGALGNIALKRTDFKRTLHPLHSFAVWGKDADYLASMKNRHSFGCDSPFSYCIGEHVKQIFLGTDYVHAMTLVHYAETCCGVPYRFPKSFEGVYITKEQKREQRVYDYAARKLEIEPEEKFNRIGTVLEDAGISKRMTIDNIVCYQVDLARSYPVFCKDIIENQCANIYDFNVPREKIFSNAL